jgi:hypothetical protein
MMVLLGSLIKAGMSLSTISTLMPRGFSSGLVWAITGTLSSSTPLAIHFAPFSGK